MGQNSVAGLASFVGLIGPDCQAIASSDRWRSCVSYSASRVTDPVRQSIRPPVVVACRGADCSYFENERFTVVLDGYIDNLRELIVDAGAAEVDAALVARVFAGQGEAAFEKFAGSFSLAIVMHDSAEVLLIRDRFGDRPLFYASTPDGWAWGSEIKILLPLLGQVTLDPEGIRQAVHYRYVLGDTVIAGVRQVMPASLVRIQAGGVPVEKQYWKLDLRPSPVGDGVESWADDADGALDACFGRLHRRYRDVGILLSGGVDSSLVAMKAARCGFRNCVALTARWPGENPELEAAAAVARHVGIEHRVIDIDDSYIETSLPWITWRLEEAPRHYNSFVLARLFAAASGNFDTLLGGHAADVLFGPSGIISLGQFQRRRRQLASLPRGLKASLAMLLRSSASRRAARFRSYLEDDEDAFIQRYFRIRYGRQLELALRRQLGPPDPGRQSVERFYDPRESAIERFQRFDLYTFNQSHTQVYDRLGTPFGIAVTTPFLSPEVVAVAERLPSALKAEGSIAKPVLKALAARYFPREWIYRPNQGFPTPASRWIDGPLARWRRALLDERAAKRGIVDIGAVREAAPGKDDEAVWTAMTLELVCRQFVDGEGGPASLEGDSEDAERPSAPGRMRS